MAKTRTAIPQKIAGKVLKEFNHRCAKCGADNPHLHHIDENPSNNDALNLIPLCPNCHLIDQHDPTRLIEPGKLRLFRVYKDPTILKPQFHPLYSRLRFFESEEGDFEIEELERKAIELVEFIFTLEKGEFYGTIIGRAIIPHDLIVWNESVPRFHNDAHKAQRATEYYQSLQKVKKQIYTLVVEALRFQSW
jgi:hypothetical protein